MCSVSFICPATVNYLQNLQEYTMEFSNNQQKQKKNKKLSPLNIFQDQNQLKRNHLRYYSLTEITNNDHEWHCSHFLNSGQWHNIMSTVSQPSLTLGMDPVCLLVSG